MEDAYVMQGEEVTMKCECLAYPLAEIMFSFIPCQNPALWPECRERKNIEAVSKVVVSSTNTLHSLNLYAHSANYCRKISDARCGTG